MAHSRGTTRGGDRGGLRSDRKPDKHVGGIVSQPQGEPIPVLFQVRRLARRTRGRSQIDHDT